MQRILLAIGGAAIFSAAVTFLLQFAMARGLPVTEIVLVTASATLILAIAAAAFAYRAYTRAKLVTAELERLTRSMDAAIKDVSLRGDREAAKLDDLNAMVSSRFDALAKKGEDDEDDIIETRPTPVNAEESAGPSRKAKPQPEPPPPEQSETANLDAALRRIVTSGQADLSVQPIIAAGRGQAGGFESHFHIQLEDEKPVDLRRLDREVPDVDPAAYERLAVVSATDAARRRLGDVSERMPLHVPISSALLQDGLEFATVLDIFKLHPALAKAIVISLPAELMEGGQHSAALELLSGHGVRLSVENWSGSEEALEVLRKEGVKSVKIDAQRLLDRVKISKDEPDGVALVSMAGKAGLDVIATDVQSEDDAVSLIEMGVDLMTGDSLSPPRRLKAEPMGARRL